MLSSSAERRLSPASSPGGGGVGSMIGGSGGGGISFPSKGAGKTFEVLWAFQLPLEAVIIGLGSALDNLGWRVVDKERKWTDGQEGKDRILAHVISYLGVRPCPSAHFRLFSSIKLLLPPPPNKSFSFALSINVWQIGTLALPF